MLTKDQNELLCRVEGAAPMGGIMRSHWLPVCLSEEVAEKDGAPVKARLAGEDLVVFRDSNGKLGVLDEHCPHRGASLVFGRNEACGLRCLYHGWKFDVDGNILEMASEPDGSALKGALRQKSYPVREAGGFVWAWLGPKEKLREFEPPAWAPKPGIKYAIVKMHAACNWAQVLEGSIDSAHSSSLHSTNMPTAEVDSAKAKEDKWLRPSNDKAPKLQFEPTSYGFRYAALRKPIRNPETNQYIRTTLFIAPFTVLIPPNDQYNLAQMLVPMDDVNTMFYWIAWHPDPKKGITQEAWRKFCAATVGEDIDQDHVRLWITLSTARELEALIGGLDSDVLSSTILKASANIEVVEEHGVTTEAEARPILITKPAYAVLVEAFEGVSDEHRIQLLTTYLRDHH